MTRPHLLGRRAFLRGGTLVLGAAVFQALRPSHLEAVEQAIPGLRIGLLTDLHFAEREAYGTRFYRESREKLREGIDRFNELKADLVVELGDFIDAAETVEEEIGYLKTIEAEYARFAGPRHYVLGNHCVHTLTKEEFLENTGAAGTFYSFDAGSFHFVVLDACFRTDGVPYGRKNFDWTDAKLPPAECDWLRSDLAQGETSTIVFTHQRLDVENNYGVKNAPEVRHILEESGRVRAVFQGHSHKNEYREINGIHYCTLRAMVEGSGQENSGYGLLEILPDGSMRLDGFRKQTSHSFSS